MGHHPIVDAVLICLRNRSMGLNPVHTMAQCAASTNSNCILPFAQTTPRGRVVPSEYDFVDSRQPQVLGVHPPRLAVNLLKTSVCRRCEQMLVHDMCGAKF